MSLLTRLWIAVASAMLLALAGTLVVSTLSARSYIEQQLYVQSSDSAASLALSMSQQSKDAAMSELLVSALFDSGHFESIIYRDVAGKTLVERRNRAPAPGAPIWFERLVPIKARTGSALVSDGWRQAGVVSVTANTRFAYEALWQGSLQMGATLALVGVLLGFAVWALLGWVRRPLVAIVSQAEAIGERRFKQVEEPNVKELRIVVRAMNAMVSRVQSMFAEQATRIDQLRDEANRDSLSSLPNRSYFMGRLREALEDESSAPGGSVIIARIIDLAGVNRRLGRERTDALLRACGAVVSDAVVDKGEAVGARLNGADFALLLPDGDPDAAEAAARGLADALGALHHREFTDRSPVAAVGWATFRRGENLGDVLGRSDAALMSAETLPQPIAGGGPTAVLPSTQGGTAWRDVVEDAIARRSFELVTYPVMNMQGGVLHREAMLRLRDTQGELISAGQFMPVAARYGQTATLDLLAVELAIGWLAQHQEDVAVNLSHLSLEQPSFLNALRAQLEFAGNRAGRIWFELNERGLNDARGVEAIGALARMLSPFRCKLGIEHFGRHFSAMPQLYALSIDYLKLDGGFVAGIDTNDGNQRFVRAAVDVARSLDIAVIAERVSTEGEWKTLVQLGVSGVNGPAVTARSNA